MATTFSNLLDLVYPKYSVFLASNDSFQPATSFGGTWAKKTGAMLAASNGKYGTSSIEKAGYNGGSATISVEQMPSHSHKTYVYALDWSASQSTENHSTSWTKTRALNNMTTYSTGGGGKCLSLTITQLLVGHALHSFFPKRAVVVM